MSTRESEDAGRQGLLGGTTEMHARSQAKDWAATPLGPLSSWPNSLRTVASLVLAMGFPSIVLWGPELVQLYNDAYIPFLGVKHPAGLGAPTRDVWPEVWEFNAPIYADVWTGQTVTLVDQPYTIRRRGPDQPSEQLYLTITYAPVRDETAAVCGVLVTLIETTAQVALREAEAKAHRTEARERALLASLPGAAAFVVDRDLRYLVAGGEALPGAGFTANRFVGHTVREVLPASLAAEHESRYRRALAGETFIVEHAAHGRSWITRGAPLRTAAGEIDAALAVSYDVTDLRAAEGALRRNEERQIFLLQLSDTLRLLVDPIEIEAEACRMLGEHLAADRTYYVELDDQRVLAGVSHDDVRGGAPSIAEAQPMSSFSATLDTLRDGRTFTCDYAAIESRITEADRLAHEACALRAFISAPILRGGRLIAAMCVTARAPRVWSPDEIALVEETAERTWDAGARARTEAALRASEEKYRTLFASIDEGVSTIEMIFDGQGHAIDFVYLEHNAALTRMTGVTADMIGRRISEIAPDLEPFWLETYGRVAITGESVRFEHSTTASGNQWFEVQASRLDDGHRKRVVVVYNDVTQRKRAEANLAFLAEVSEDLTRLTSIDDTMNALGAKIGRYLGLSACAFVELEQDAHVGVVTHGWHRAGMPSLLGTYRMEQFVAPEVLRRCRTGQVVVVRDVFADPSTDGERYAALDIGSFVAIPFVRDGAWRFLLVVYRSEPSDWSDDKVELIRELTSRIWTRLERERADAAVRESEARQAFLLRLTDMIRQVSDPMSVQRLAMDALGEHMSVNRAMYFELMPDADTLIAGPGYVRDVHPMPPVARLSGFSDALAAQYRRGETLAAADVLADFGAEWAHAFAAIEVRATIGVPLIKAGRLVAIMGVHQRMPRQWTAADVALMKAVAERTWAAVERARAETALRESEARFRTLVDNVRDYAIFLLDARGNVTEWTASAQRLKGYTAEEALGLPLAHFYTPEDLEQGIPELELEEAARQGRAEREGWRVRKDGSRFWVDEIATAVRGVDGVLLGFTKISRDLTERRRVEAAILRERADQDRDVRRRELAAAEEAERRRIARELHDQLGQQLTAFTLGLAETERLTAAHAPQGSELRKRLDSMMSLAQRMMSGARYLALELRPPELDDLGLESALETYVREWSERYGIRADATVTGINDATIPEDVMNALYRITQEALTNVAKHASATDVSIILEKPDGEVRLIVEDNGRGFDVSETAVQIRRERRLGLSSMRERAALIRGSLLIESSADHGTTIYVRVPLHAPFAPGAAKPNEETTPA